MVKPLHTIVPTTLAALVLSLTACVGAPEGAGDEPAPGPTEEVTGNPTPATESQVPEPTGELGSGEFAPYAEGATAVTYDERVPEGSSAEAKVNDDGGKTTVSLSVKGFEPESEYGSHVHVAACGSDPDDAGPHYQDQQDPATQGEDVVASTDPAYANPKNEIWLDFTTDAQGNADVESTVDWQFREGEGRSVVIHATHTGMQEGEAGEAGDRLACITIR
ncbi:superoxide dismutase family protein [Arthrobacter crystallopoietes]|nr:superoxide dismutase family protein [Arthrobacter crystallopoietes]